MYRITLLTVLLIGIHMVYSQTCKESPSRVCSHPKVETIDFKWFQSNQPDDGWHMEFGNSAVRLHLAELIQGKLLSYNDDYSNMCGRIRLEHSESSVDGKFYGFDGKKVAFQCFPSKSDEGAIECDYSSIGLSKYADASVNYLTYSDNKNLAIAIFCFPNGENGWFSMSKAKTLTEAEKDSVKEHVKSIGYDNTDFVPMYSEACTDNTVNASHIYSQRARADHDRRRRLRNKQRSSQRLNINRYSEQ